MQVPQTISFELACKTALKSSGQHHSDCYVSSQIRVTLHTDTPAYCSVANRHRQSYRPRHAAEILHTEMGSGLTGAALKVSQRITIIRGGRVDWTPHNEQ